MLCAFKAEAQSLVLGAFIRALFAFYRRRARRAGLPDGGGRCGALTVIQRFGSACEVNLHLHSPPRTASPSTPPRAREDRIPPDARPC